MKIICFYILLCLCFLKNNASDNDDIDITIKIFSNSENTIFILSDPSCRLKYMPSNKTNIEVIPQNFAELKTINSEENSITYQCFGDTSKSQRNNVDFLVYLPYDLFYKEFMETIQPKYTPRI